MVHLLPFIAAHGSNGYFVKNHGGRFTMLVFLSLHGLEANGGLNEGEEWIMGAREVESREILFIP